MSSDKRSLWRITPSIEDYWEGWSLWHYDSSFGKWDVYARYFHKQDAVDAMREMSK